MRVFAYIDVIGLFRAVLLLAHIYTARFKRHAPPK